MADDPNATTPPKINTPRKALQWLWKWGLAHTVISAGILGALSGFIAGKVL